jgi:polysaccharide chain length determinant protein (PEP-CTERM system associated)
MQLQTEQLIKLLVSEIFLSRRMFVGAFSVIALGLLSAGLVWPTRYTSTTTIHVDERSIIQPLMQGAAVTTEAVDRARLAREVIFGRRFMGQMAQDIGGAKADSSPAALESIANRLMAFTKISNEGQNLIKIQYNDVDPDRAFRITKRYAELFIHEAMEAKAAESHAAYDFIEKQAQEYHEKLAAAEERLKEFRSANIDARPGSEADISARLSALQTRIEQATQELKETEIKKQSLEKQLSGEAETASALSREQQYRVRIGELQAQLETLRLSYHDTYPDIVRIRHQINDLNEAIAADRQRREAARASGQTVIDDSVINNPMYQQIKKDLSQAQVQIDTLNARINEARRQLHSELERGRRVHGGEATLAELTRDYQVNRDIFQDLLKRRENARVSMNIDKERQGLSFKIQEPAALPTSPSGIHFIHFVLMGVVLGIAVPVGLVYGKLRLDPRIRVPAAVIERLKLPVLATVPHTAIPAEIEQQRDELPRLMLLGLGTLVIVVVLTLLRTFYLI